MRILIVVGACLFWTALLFLVLWLGSGGEKYQATRRIGHRPPAGPYDSRTFAETGTIPRYPDSFGTPEAEAQQHAQIIGTPPTEAEIRHSMMGPRVRPETLADLPRHSADLLGGETTKLDQYLDAPARAMVRKPGDDVG